MAQGNGLQTTRAISILEAINGDFDIPGGGISISHSDDPNEKLSVKPVGAVESPFWYEIKLHAQVNLIPEVILNSDPYPIKNRIVIGGNPVLIREGSRYIPVK